MFLLNFPKPSGAAVLPVCRGPAAQPALLAAQLLKGKGRQLTLFAERLHAVGSVAPTLDSRYLQVPFTEVCSTILCQVLLTTLLANPSFSHKLNAVGVN